MASHLKYSCTPRASQKKLPSTWDRFSSLIISQTFTVCFSDLYCRPLLLIISFLCMLLESQFSPGQGQSDHKGIIWIHHYLTSPYPLFLIGCFPILASSGTSTVWSYVPVVSVRPWKWANSSPYYVTPEMKFLYFPSYA